MMKPILAVLFVVLASAVVKADQVLISTGGNANVLHNPSGDSNLGLNIAFANGSMSYSDNEATVYAFCNQAGCAPGTTISVGVNSGPSHDFIQITLDGVTHTCVSTPCIGFFSLLSTVTIPDDGGSGPLHVFSVTVPFTLTGSVYDQFGEHFSISGSGFASLSFSRPGGDYMVNFGPSMNYTFTPEPYSIVLLISGLTGLGCVLRKRIRQ